MTVLSSDSLVTLVMQGLLAWQCSDQAGLSAGHLRDAADRRCSGERGRWPPRALGEACREVRRSSAVVASGENRESGTCNWQWRVRRTVQHVSWLPPANAGGVSMALLSPCLACEQVCLLPTRRKPG